MVSQGRQVLFSLWLFLPGPGVLLLSTNDGLSENWQIFAGENYQLCHTKIKTVIFILVSQKTSYPFKQLVIEFSGVKKYRKCECIMWPSFNVPQTGKLSHSARLSQHIDIFCLKNKHLNHLSFDSYVINGNNIIIYGNINSRKKSMHDDKCSVFCFSNVNKV